MDNGHPRFPYPRYLRVPFVFVPHGALPPLEWMAEHPGWVKFPATFVPRAPLPEFEPPPPQPEAEPAPEPEPALSESPARPAQRDHRRVVPPPLFEGDPRLTRPRPERLRKIVPPPQPMLPPPPDTRPEWLRRIVPPSPPKTKPGEGGFTPAAPGRRPEGFTPAPPPVPVHPGRPPVENKPTILEARRPSDSSGHEKGAGVESGAISARALTPADVGVEAGLLPQLSGTVSGTGKNVTVNIGIIEGTIPNPFSFINHLKAMAEAQGATSLTIEGTLANERLLNVLVRRYGAKTVGGLETIVIPLERN